MPAYFRYTWDDYHIAIYIILLLLLLSRFSRVRLCVTPEMAAHQALPSWDSPGKNTGVGCHFLLQGMKVKSESEIAQLCLTLREPSILKSRDITLQTKVCLVKAMVFPIVMYGCESWTVKKAECRRIDAFELWCWRSLESLGTLESP